MSKLDNSQPGLVGTFTKLHRDLSAGHIPKEYTNF